MGSRVLHALALGFALLVAVMSIGCTPQVGDSCALSTDCGSTGNLVCDTSQFLGYCTLLGCVPNQCPNNAVCVLFDPSVPGCGYNDRDQGSRISQQFCMAVCSTNSDCRPGYLCASPTQSPWFADILDNNTNNRVCIPIPNGMVGGGAEPMVDPDAAVCQVTGPTYDAFPPPPEAQTDAANGE